jgi:predicted nucleic acid-binding protein
MRTAIDTNVLSALWSSEPISSLVDRALNKARIEGALAVSAALYAELLAHPKMTEERMNAFLGETGVTVDFDLPKQIWLEAGRRFTRYVQRRRRSGDGRARRLLADFIIGAHALTQADRLMTLDPGRFKRDFPELQLI